AELEVVLEVHARHPLPEPAHTGGGKPHLELLGNGLQKQWQVLENVFARVARDRKLVHLETFHHAAYLECVPPVRDHGVVNVLESVLIPEARIRSSGADGGEAVLSDVSKSAARHKLQRVEVVWNLVDAPQRLAVESDTKIVDGACAEDS